MMVYKLIVIAFIVAVMMVFFTGCSFSMGQKAKSELLMDEPPTPGVQLWQAAKKSNWLVTASILGIAGGVFALSNGATKMGSAVIASASVSLFMTLAVSRFALWMSVFGLLGSLAVVAFSILARRRALVEIIKGVQKSKNNISAATVLKTELTKQSTTTKKIVSNIKNELKLKGVI